MKNLEGLKLVTRGGTGNPDDARVECATPTGLPRFHEAGVGEALVTRARRATTVLRRF